jgi:hypothetical protein
VLPRSYFDQFMRNQVPAGIAVSEGGSESGGGENDYLDAGGFGGGSNILPFGPGIYGFNWWFNENGSGWSDAPPDLIHANGHGNKELMFVQPSQGIVIAARGDWGTWEPGGDSDVNRLLRLLVQAAR